MKSSQELEALHLRLQDMLAGYVDGELDEQEIQLLEAHLSGCEACANDLARQQLLHEALGNIPHEHLSSAQQARLDEVLETALSDNTGKRSALSRSWKKTLRRLGADIGIPLAAVGGWGLAAILALVIVFNGSWPTVNNAIPMVEDAVAEYQHVAQSPLPNTDVAKTGQPPASWPQARVLASWPTYISGKPALAYAMRNGNRMLLQVKVGEQVFYNNPRVRSEIGRMGRFETQEQGLKVVAMPLEEGGLLLVGPPDSIPSADSLSLKTF